MKKIKSINIINFSILFTIISGISFLLGLSCSKPTILLKRPYKTYFLSKYSNVNISSKDINDGKIFCYSEIEEPIEIDYSFLVDGFISSYTDENNLTASLIKDFKLLVVKNCKTYTLNELKNNQKIFKDKIISELEHIYKTRFFEFKVSKFEFII